MNSHCIRQGQVEIGVIEHEGHEFAALGATVDGRHVTGYTKNDNGALVLTTWSGQTMLACRSTVVERFWSGSVALFFRLGHGRFIAGYALSDDGMLFRGELLTDSDDDDARRTALHLSDHFAELDAEDECEFAEEE